jgi:putative endonuclease
MKNPRAKGQAIEQAAQHWLEQQGLRSHQRNFHGRYGELDLIMFDGHTLVFIEVRYRANSLFGSGAESVTLIKQNRLKTAAERYLQQEFGDQWPSCRFDVVSASGSPVEFEWIKNAF